MDIDSVSDAEMHAQKAERLPAFMGFNLLNTKQKVADLLSFIGRGDLFDQYTKHDISHVDKMLRVLDWLIPYDTKEAMSPVDWLLIVLAIYFHDLGMLVTKKEYDLRKFSGFPEFCQKTLFSGNEGKDYSEKVKAYYSDPGQADRFLYQEFVRSKHAERIRMWIVGKAPESLGINYDTMREVDKLLEPLSSLFRRDLAFICESHHLDDLDNFKKYRTLQPYGDSDDETANLHYAAVVLRTADLLHITSDRTPSIAYRIINPSDPLSQEEWAKQRAVTRVKPQIGRDREGNPDERAPRDTIEIYANFFREDGFFGLTSYLAYVAEQLRKTYDWVKAANRIYKTRYEFPWHYIDDSNVETEGFIRENFEFTIDQNKILDLLTGHTLYNDTSVVIRELVQNSLDAVRLQQFLDGKSGLEEVQVHWNSQERVLSIRDNGTGMTQIIIERHLLRVGSSRYQDSEFKKKYPGFSSISRFGIGVLSAFMVADSVEITTCHPEEDQVRQISLRSVHGKYLIRLLDKETDEIARSLVPHGTLVKLKIRASAAISDIIRDAQKWIVIPRCKVSFIKDDEMPVLIGFSSPKEALEDVLKKQFSNDKNSMLLLDQGNIKVEQQEVNGVTLAYALKWLEYFQEWIFLSAQDSERARLISDTTLLVGSSNREGRDELFLGTCVEGVRVDFGTPGFIGNSVYAIADATGPNAPKTNVARSGLEATPERYELLQTVYSIYCNQINKELQEIQNNAYFSLTWVVNEAGYLLSFLTREDREALDAHLLRKAIWKLPMVLVEQDGQRKAVPVDYFINVDSFWQIESKLVKNAELLIQQIQSNVSLSDLASILNVEYPQTQNAPVLCSFIKQHLEEHIFAGREIDTIHVYRDQIRVDIRWSNALSSPRWLNLNEILQSVSDIMDPRVLRVFSEISYRKLRIARQTYFNVYVPVGDVEFSGLLEEIGVQIYDVLYLVPKSPLAVFFASLIEQLRKELSHELFQTIYLLEGYLGQYVKREGHFLDINVEEEVGLKQEILKFQKIMEAVGTKCFNPYAWNRKNSEND